MPNFKLGQCRTRTVLWVGQSGWRSHLWRQKLKFRGRLFLDRVTSRHLPDPLILTLLSTVEESEAGGHSGLFQWQMKIQIEG